MPMFRLAPFSKWAARITALLVVLFWGPFFVEHLWEWFLKTGGRYPPPQVWAAMAAHFAMIVGALMMLKWGRAGAWVLAAGTLGFLAAVGDWDVVPIGMINLVPIALFVIHRRASKS